MQLNSNDKHHSDQRKIDALNQSMNKNFPHYHKLPSNYSIGQPHLDNKIFLEEVDAHRAKNGTAQKTNNGTHHHNRTENHQDYIARD